MGYLNINSVTIVTKNRGVSKRLPGNFNFRNLKLNDYITIYK